MTTIRLLDLPSEILIIILNSLDLPTLSHCLSTNRYLKCLVDDSSLLQYRRASLAACVEDNPCSAAISSAKRLDALQKRQRSFADLLPSFTYPIPMDDFPMVSSYALSGGIFAMLESEGKSLRFVALPSAQNQTASWEHLEVDEFILEFALAVPEDDLLVVLTCNTPHFHLTSADTTIKLRFYEVSTQSAHSRAREFILPLPVSAVEIPELCLDICGSKVALLSDPAPNRLLIYDWNTGRLQMASTDLTGNYSAAIFLSSDIILLACTETGDLELWAIPDSPEQIAARSEISLKLPQLKSGGKYYPGKVESNPKGPQSSTSQQPFHSSFADSLVVIHLEIEVVSGDAGQNFQEADVMLVVPRRALLQQLPTYADRSTGAARGRPWVEWGPPVSRWLESDMFADFWPTIICGQRCVFKDYSVSGAVVLFDFNPWTFQKMLLQKAEVVDEPTLTKKFPQVVAASINQFLEMDVFDEEVDSHLGYVVACSSREDWYEGILMDEECLVGIRDKTGLDDKLSLDFFLLKSLQLAPFQNGGYPG
ncbi:hypothetical protein C8R43DRAFT_1235673 [Mycena crocata]|nr:hypothetical protein C8R43DRAFT_1235673 [Mycena crocata]